jgi:GPI ethanolamine phosphate transferase 3 subunit O
MMTGTLPAFLEFGENFDTLGAEKVSEDSLLAQTTHNRLTTAFVGDDTWAKLFPGLFSESRPYPSFDVWDLDSVDAGVRRHIFPALAQNPGFDLIIAHYLGVDHVGHRYHADHPAMAEKLTEIDGDIRRVLAGARPDDLVLVLGDHGMTARGNHGGDSREETTAALFAFSEAHVACDALLGTGIGHVAGPRRMDQLDLAATLSV